MINSGQQRYKATKQLPNGYVFAPFAIDNKFDSLSIGDIVTLENYNDINVDAIVRGFTFAGIILQPVVDGKLFEG